MWIHILIAVCGIGVGTMFGVVVMAAVAMGSVEDDHVRGQVLRAALIRLVQSARAYDEPGSSDRVLTAAIRQAVDALDV